MKILSPIPISSQTYPGLWNMNPTVSLIGSEFHIFGRATSFVLNPRANSRGHSSLSTTHSEKKAIDASRHSVVGNALFSGVLMPTGELVNQQILLPESPPLFFLEDVRAFKFEDQNYLIGTWTNQVLDGQDLVIKQSIAIYSTKDRNCHFLDSPFGLSMKKNWVPMEVVDNKLMVFYSSQPGRVLEINLNTANVKVNSIKSDPTGLDFHGRSQFVRLPNNNFLRVASLRLPIKDFGLVHYSSLLEHGAIDELVSQ
jgi:hypothetical protein